MKISRILTVKNLSAYYYEDVSALHANPTAEDERWFATGGSPGFKALREPAEVVSLGIEVNGQVFWGDVVGVSYAGKAGRRGVFRAQDGIREIVQTLQPWLLEQTFVDFRSTCQSLKEFNQKLAEPLHVATLYGISQALLLAFAAEKAPYKTIADLWQLPFTNLEPLPIQGSCGNNFHGGTDKMLVHRLAALPHSQVDNIPDQVGADGGIFLQRSRWLKERILKFDHKNYCPVIHLDVHGAFGKIFNLDVAEIAKFLLKVETVLLPYQLRIESPLLGSSREEHLGLISKLDEELRKLGSKTVLAIDEWANTYDDIKYFVDNGFSGMIHIKMPDLGIVAEVIDAVLYCKKNSVKVLLGGSCIETEISSKIGTHIAMITRPDFVLARPGMGIDEAIMLTHNEMHRVAALSRC